MTSSDPTRYARLIVDLDAIAANYRHLRSLARSSEMAAVVKADAYGLGASAVAKRLIQEGCREFFVATPQEGVSLRTVLGRTECNIWVLNGLQSDVAYLFKAATLNPILNSAEQVAAFTASGLTRPFALHIDTAMNRLGVSTDEAAALADSGLTPTIVMSHLACSEDTDTGLNALQLKRFEAIAACFPQARKSLANTGGVYLGPAYQHDLCRPGIGLAGATALPGQDHGLTPAARLEAPILQLRQLQPGATVGYGATFTADRPILAATVATGYADGLPRSLSNKGWARVGGAKAPILGRVSMDLTTLDVTNVADNVQVGEMATFLGKDLEALAAAAGTLPYELLTGIGPGVERVVR